MTEIKLPDFDDLLSIAGRIGEFSTQKILFEYELERRLAHITSITSSNEEYFVNDKPPSMAYTEANYHKLGVHEKFGEELTELGLESLRSDIANITGDLEAEKNRFKVLTQLVDVWKADQYNKNQAEY